MAWLYCKTIVGHYTNVPQACLIPSHCMLQFPLGLVWFWASQRLPTNQNWKPQSTNCSFFTAWQAKERECSGKTHVRLNHNTSNSLEVLNLVCPGLVENEVSHIALRTRILLLPYNFFSFWAVYLNQFNEWCNPIHTFLGVNPTDFNGTYFQWDMPRNGLYVSYTANTWWNLWNEVSGGRKIDQHL